MAFPSIADYSIRAVTAESETFEISMPNTVAAGDLLVAYFTVDDNTTSIAGFGDGDWTQLYSIADNLVVSLCYYKTATGAEAGTTVPLSISAGTGTERCVGLVFAIKGWQGTPEYAAFDNGSSGTALTSPAINPAGWATEDTLWLQAYHGGASSDISAYPAGYSGAGTYTVLAFDSNVGNISVVYKQEAVEFQPQVTPAWTVTNGGGTVTLVAIRPGAAVAEKYLKVLIDPAAQGAGGVSGAVFSAPAQGFICGTKIGEFTGVQFDAALESGQAKLLVPVSSFGGSALDVTDTPVVLVRNATDTTGIIPATIIQE